MQKKKTLGKPSLQKSFFAALLEFLIYVIFFFGKKKEKALKSLLLIKNLF